MMKFEDVTLTWGDESKTVKANDVMLLIDAIEEYVRLAELMDKRGTPFARLAFGYHAALRFAGFDDVTPQDVYLGMFDKTNQAQVIRQATEGLLHMMVPNDVSTNTGSDEDSKPKKKEKTRKK